MPTREFPGYSLTITSGSSAAVSIKIAVFRRPSAAADSTTYEREFNEEQIAELHAIFFDPTLIMELHEMVPDNVSFGRDDSPAEEPSSADASVDGSSWCELRWKFEIRKRSHLVIMRLYEETPPEGADPEIFSLRQEVAGLRRELAECRAELRAVSYIEKETDLCSSYFDMKWHGIGAVLNTNGNKVLNGHEETLSLFNRLLGTPYGNRMRINEFFSDEAVQQAFKRPLNHYNPFPPAIEEYFRKLKMPQPEVAEMAFNIEHQGLSVESFSLEGKCESVPKIPCEFNPSNFRMVSHSLKSRENWIYLFRTGEHKAPVGAVVFDMKDVVSQKIKKLQQYLLDVNLRWAYTGFICREELKIYKVRVD